MSYYADLTPYEYSDSDHEMSNIGWLAIGHNFEVGDVSSGFVDALTLCAVESFHETRGFHSCEFCAEESPVRVKRPDGSRYVSLGMAEIHVAGANGQRYAAPDLIVHYVLAHNYRPPEEFQRAVILDNATRVRPFYVCTICGYPELDEPETSERGTLSGMRCPSCGTRPNTDLADASAAEIRGSWIESGMPWCTPWIPAPTGWSPITQLHSVAGN